MGDGGLGFRNEIHGTCRGKDREGEISWRLVKDQEESEGGKKRKNLCCF